MPLDFELLIAAPSDADDIRAFRCKDPGANYTRVVERLVRGEIADAVASAEADVCVHLARLTDERTLVGVICHSPVENGPPPIHTISALAVTNIDEGAYRRKGIGIALKSDVLCQLGLQGIAAVHSEVHVRNFPMLRLNEKLDAIAHRDPDDANMMLTMAGSPIVGDVGT